MAWNLATAAFPVFGIIFVDEYILCFKKKNNKQQTKKKKKQNPFQHFNGKLTENVRRMIL